jgi:predicted DNA-binding transcriptional regulator AlpA
MKELEISGQARTPILFPYDPIDYWESIRKIIREEISVSEKVESKISQFETPGLTYKPLYKIAEVCQIFQITKPTIYDWVKHGKLKPFKIRSRVYFLWQDIEKLIQRK